MKKVWFYLLLLTLSFGNANAGSAVENALISDTQYTLMGTFGTHDFAGADTAFDWAFTMLSTGKSYQLQGKPPSDNDVFGWEEVNIATPTPAWYMFQLNGDVDGDGSIKFDWVLVSTNMNSKAAYKLAGVAVNGTFEYSSKLNIDYLVSGNAITTGVAGSLASVTVANVEQYSVALGQTKTFEKSHIIHSNTTATISGNLQASTDAGQDITIEAEGDITVSGSITAGGSSTGSADGGTVTLYSKNGNIVIDAGAHLNAGNGLSPTGFDTRNAPLRSISLTNNGKGGEGGSIILRAPNGGVTIPATSKSLRIGNGGNGSELQVHGDSLNDFTGEDMNLGGGDSGTLIIESDNIEGLVYTQKMITEDILDDEGNVLYSAGDTIMFIEITDQIGGGIGGNGGDFVFGMDENNQSTWPQSANAAQLMRQSYDDFKFYDEFDLKDDKIMYYYSKYQLVTVQPQNKGGKGYGKGGTGADCKVTGPNGRFPGGDAWNVMAYGGNGGDCYSSADCSPGIGGTVKVIGGNGANGEDPDQKGGNGANVNAVPGGGGCAITEDKIGTMADLPTMGGIGIAIGGKGGTGGNGCLETKADQGGNGGYGGNAVVYVQINSFAPIGPNIAVGGDGGDGNKGVELSGSFGQGGTGFIRDYFSGLPVSGYTNNGKNGVELGLCPYEFQFPMLTYAGTKVYVIDGPEFKIIIYLDPNNQRVSDTRTYCAEVKGKVYCSDIDITHETATEISFDVYPASNPTCLHSFYGQLDGDQLSGTFDWCRGTGGTWLTEILPESEPWP